MNQLKRFAKTKYLYISLMADKDICVHIKQYYGEENFRLKLLEKKEQLKIKEKQLALAAAASSDGFTLKQQVGNASPLVPQYVTLQPQSVTLQPNSVRRQRKAGQTHSRAGEPVRRQAGRARLLKCLLLSCLK